MVKIQNMRSEEREGNRADGSKSLNNEQNQYD